MRVGLVTGGQSAERAVSLSTSAEIGAALARLGIDAVSFEIDADLSVALQKARVDVVFPALHGGSGENGILQGVLELLEIPYVGSGVLASALGMDKAMAKTVFAAAGLRSPRGIVILRSSGVERGLLAVRETLGGAPYMVKPNNEGSAIGASRVFTDDELKEAIEASYDVSHAVLVEQFVRGREITVGVIEGGDGPQALPSIEIVSATDWYDYAARYTVGQSTHICPGNVSPEIETLLQETGLRAHFALGCRDYSRTDCLLTDANEVFVLETNTLPGMTPTSLFPDAARAAGYSFDNVVAHLVMRAYDRRRA